MGRFVTKNNILNGVVYGYVAGFCIGLACNRAIHINYKGTHCYFPKMSVPFVSGFICSSSVLLSPLFAVHFVFENWIGSHKIDKFINHHDINIYRCTRAWGGKVWPYESDEGKKYDSYPNTIFVDVQTKIIKWKNKSLKFENTSSDKK